MQEKRVNRSHLLWPGRIRHKLVIENYIRFKLWCFCVNSFFVGSGIVSQINAHSLLHPKQEDRTRDNNEPCSIVVDFSYLPRPSTLFKIKA